jgi:hypothetical protein
MAEFSLQLSTAKMVVMADALARAGDIETARSLYRQALPQANPELRNRIRIRLGLALQRDRRSQMSYDILDALETFSPRDYFLGDGLATWMKTTPFLEDERFAALAEAHSGLLPARNWHWNLQIAAWCVRRARDVPGDLVELGVFKGHTTLFCAEYLDFAAWPKRWWLYDTFEGIPDDQVDVGFAHLNKGAYNPATFSFEEVRARFAHIPNIDVIQGRAPEILLETAPANIAFLHIDLNNVAAEIASLDLLFDRVSPGGLILFDDYLWANARAQYDAETAWFEARGEQILPLPTGQGLYIKR